MENQILTVINVIPLLDLDINSTIFCFSCIIISVVSDAQGATDAWRWFISFSCCFKFKRISCNWRISKLCVFSYEKQNACVVHISISFIIILTWSDDSICSKLSLGRLARLSSVAAVKLNNLSTSNPILSCFQPFSKEYIVFELVIYLKDIFSCYWQNIEFMRWNYIKYG